MTAAELYAMVADALSADVSTLRIESGLNHHPAWDSLAHVRVLAAIEKNLGVVLDDAAVERFASMANILELATDRFPEGNRMTTSTDLSFHSFDGLTIGGTLTRPPGPLRGRALLVHGMTANREEWGFFTALADRLAGLGIASLRMDYRSHGVAESFPTLHFSLAGVLNDIDAGYRALVAATGTEGRAFIVGVSFGAGLSARWAAEHADEISKVFLCSPVIDYVADISKTAPDWLEQVEDRNAFEYAGRDFSRALINEARYLNGESTMSAPPMSIVIFHGDSDNDVPVEKSRGYAALSEQCELIEVPGADHGFGIPGDADLNDPQSMANYEFVFERLTARCLS